MMKGFDIDKLLEWEDAFIVETGRIPEGRSIAPEAYHPSLQATRREFNDWCDNKGYDRASLWTPDDLSAYREKPGG